MEELNNENVEYYNAEVIEENYDESDSGNGALVAVGLGLLGVAGAAAAGFVANKMGKLDGIKERRRAKKIERLENKLEKEYVLIQQNEKKPEETKEEE